MEHEEWKQVDGYDGRYVVSSLGRVVSLPNLANNEPHFIKQSISSNGYAHVTLSGNNKQKTVSVHRLVADAFIEKRGDGFQVNHKNEDKTDNRASNLEWVTAKENCNYGSRNVRRKPVEAMKDGKVIASYPSARIAASEIGIDHSCVTRCCNGKRRSANGYTFRYASNGL